MAQINISDYEFIKALKDFCANYEDDLSVIVNEILSYMDKEELESVKKEISKINADLLYSEQ